MQLSWPRAGCLRPARRVQTHDDERLSPFISTQQTNAERDMHLPYQQKRNLESSLWRVISISRTDKVSALGRWRPVVQKTEHNGIRACSRVVSCRVEHTVCRARWRNEQSNVARRFFRKMSGDTEDQSGDINRILAHGESKL